MIANVREAISKPDGSYDFDAVDGYDELKYVQFETRRRGRTGIVLFADHSTAITLTFRLR